MPFRQLMNSAVQTYTAGTLLPLPVAAGCAMTYRPDMIPAQHAAVPHGGRWAARVAVERAMRQDDFAIRGLRIPSRCIRRRKRIQLAEIEEYVSRLP
jgi:hypothetical protein